jgi:hypothetical protein
MSKLLLLVQSAADVAALPAATAAIVKLGFSGVWCVYSPAVLTDEKTVNTKFDKQIADLNVAIEAAVKREDFDACKTYKDQRANQILEKSAAVKEAWKALDEDDKKKAAMTIFSPLMTALKSNGINGKITQHNDHYEPSASVEMVNSLKGAWHPPFTPGSYMTGWPTSFDGLKGAPAATPIVGHPTPVSPAPVAPKPARPETAPTRNQEIRAMKGPELRALASQLGIAWEGKKHMTLVSEVILADSSFAAVIS